MRLLAAVGAAWLLLLLAPLTINAVGSDVDSWRSQAIYQFLTDRFAGSTSGCNLRDYCGGTFNGAKDKADYVADLGFDAIWISPVVANSPRGYHGYWASDFSKINSKFGSAGDLKQMVKAYNDKGMKVMVDVVANHIGDGIRLQDSFPFNRPEHYHDCKDCDQYCSIPPSAWGSNDFRVIEHCRLQGLQDLNQDNPFVRSYLLGWIKNLTATYGFDGIRIDTVLLVKKDFWGEFVKASGVFAIGEANNGDPQIVGPYQDVIHSPLSFPMYYTLRDVFARQQSMWNLHNRRDQYQKYFKDPSVLTTFVDSHDVPRFLSVQRDYHLYYNALTWVLLAEGIPVVYYGTEAGYGGGDDPNNREALWTDGYDTQHPIYVFLKAVNKYRKAMRVWEHPHQETWVTNDCYTFQRGPDVIVVLTKVGRDTVRYNCPVPLPDGWQLGASDKIVSVPLGFVPQGTLTRASGSPGATAKLFHGAPAVFIRPGSVPSNDDQPASSHAAAT